MLGIKIFRFIFFAINFFVMIRVTTDQNAFFVALLIYTSSFLCDYILKLHEVYNQNDKLSMFFYGVGCLIATVLVILSSLGLIGTITFVNSDNIVMLSFSENYLFKELSFRIYYVMLALVILLAVELSLLFKEIFVLIWRKL